MKAAIVVEAGKAPVYGDFKAPVAAAGENLVTVTAAALSHIVRGRASGTHYSSAGELPFVAGVDGVGRLDSGKRVYFILPRAPYGSMAEKAVAPAEQCLELPDDLDDLSAAAIANPGMSSWAAFRERAKLQAGETVLINGATGTAGRLAVQIAKHMGAAKVVATGRNAEVLRSLKSLGADVVIPLTGDLGGLEGAFKEQFAEGVNVVLDYLWGGTAESLLIAGAKAGKEAVPIRFVQVGSMGGPDITLPGAALRSSAITLMGSGLNSVPAARLLQAIADLFRATVPGKFRIKANAVPLSEVERAWAWDESKGRTVFVPAQSAA